MPEAESRAQGVRGFLEGGFCKPGRLAGKPPRPDYGIRH